MQLDSFANRLRKNQRHWHKWASRRAISCYRIYDRDIPEFPLAIDWYDRQVHAQLFARSDVTEPDPTWERSMADTLCAVLAVDSDDLAFKARRRQRGRSQYEKTGKQGQPGIVHESDLAFEVDLHSYLDTGLFLDHRITRSMVRERSAGKCVLNLFAYTGSFTIYAAAGGASNTISVDMSKTYLAWSQRNLQLNGLAAASHTFVRADVLQYLNQARRQRKQFDLIILDPPSFSNSKKMQHTLDVQRDHPRLIRACHDLLKPGGELFFSTNRRKFRLDPQIAADDACTEITHQTVPEDFRRHPIHRCWLLQKS